jgi:hypothetical protein
MKKIFGAILGISLAFTAATSFAANENALTNITAYSGTETSVTKQVIMISNTPVESKVSFNHGKFTAVHGEDKVTGHYNALMAKNGLIYLIGSGLDQSGGKRNFNSIYTPLKKHSMYHFKTIITNPKDGSTMVISGDVKVNTDEKKKS